MALKAMDLGCGTGSSGASNALKPCVLGDYWPSGKALGTPRRLISPYPNIEGVRYFVYD
jgi:hypothetical protein